MRALAAESFLLICKLQFCLEFPIEFHGLDSLKVRFSRWPRLSPGPFPRLPAEAGSFFEEIEFLFPVLTIMLPSLKVHFPYSQFCQCHRLLQVVSSSLWSLFSERPFSFTVATVQSRDAAALHLPLRISCQSSISLAASQLRSWSSMPQEFQWDCTAQSGACYLFLPSCPHLLPSHFQGH